MTDLQPNSFSDRLDFLMGEVLNISGYAMGTDLNVNQGLISRYRRGDTEPSIGFAEKICSHYGISANWLILGIDPVYLNDINTVSPDPLVKRMDNKKALLNDVDLMKDYISKFEKVLNDFTEKIAL